MKKVEIGV